MAAWSLWVLSLSPAGHRAACDCGVCLRTPSPSNGIRPAPISAGRYPHTLPQVLHEADSSVSPALPSPSAAFSGVLQLMDLLGCRSMGLGSSKAAGTKPRALANTLRSEGSKPKLNLSQKFGSESQIQEVVHENWSGHCFLPKSSSAKNNVLRHSYK